MTKMQKFLAVRSVLRLQNRRKCLRWSDAEIDGVAMVVHNKLLDVEEPEELASAAEPLLANYITARQNKLWADGPQAEVF